MNTAVTWSHSTSMPARQHTALTRTTEILGKVFKNWETLRWGEGGQTLPPTQGRRAGGGQRSGDIHTGDLIDFGTMNEFHNSEFTIIFSEKIEQLWFGPKKLHLTF